ncbi:iron complex transport system permease protein [Nannocystis exedens]|uniref:Iron complex transport system permease protein n=1 Tax=Nannocystis exedens TaxID=54 RepID=A0A1I1WF18_9BACT|nr:iron ABC transporter permease [Nannocystis exedens]PCC67561.1 iron(III) ABC transporter permease [Nannocystis exedens]SFD91983.1 iron complex transport system permease protein [Nannocystis exedens]
MTRTTWLAAAAIPLALLVSLGTGPGEIGLGEALGVIGRRLSGDDLGLRGAIVWDLRLPRALLAGLVGAALAAAGALCQGLFRNPMADPGVLGVSSGAALFAVVGLLFNLDRAGLWAIPVVAAVGAAAAMVLLLAAAGRQASLAVLLLAGVALGALCSALITVCQALASHQWDFGLKVVYWLMGSFEGRSWPHLSWAVPPCGLGLALALWLRRDLDALHLGSDAAASLGVDLARLRLLVVVAVGLLVGAATALTGVLAFVGLVAPHVARMSSGPGHRRLVPLAALVGASATILVDAVARSASGVVIPPGVITSLVGAPFFLWLLRRRGLRGLAG